MGWEDADPEHSLLAGEQNSSGRKNSLLKRVLRTSVSVVGDISNGRERKEEKFLEGAVAEEMFFSAGMRLPRA